MADREATEAAILLALEEQIKETGMVGVGVNVIAKRAGVSKELIYRYFGGLQGLMLTWMQQQDFWTGRAGTLHQEGASDRTPSELILTMLFNQREALTENTALREIRRWELVELNDVTSELGQRREARAREFIDRLDGVSKGVDLPAVVSIMLAGVLYLSLRSKTESHFLGVPIRTEEGWDRLRRALESMVAGLPSELRTKSLRELERKHPASKGGRAEDVAVDSKQSKGKEG